MAKHIHLLIEHRFGLTGYLFHVGRAGFAAGCTGGAVRTTRDEGGGQGEGYQGGLPRLGRNKG
jgi:hypothetical protein